MTQTIFKVSASEEIGDRALNAFDKYEMETLEPLERHTSVKVGEHVVIQSHFCDKNNSHQRIIFTTT